MFFKYNRKKKNSFYDSLPLLHIEPYTILLIITVFIMNTFSKIIQKLKNEQFHSIVLDYNKFIMEHVIVKRKSCFTKKKVRKKKERTNCMAPVKLLKATFVVHNQRIICEIFEAIVFFK